MLCRLEITRNEKKLLALARIESRMDAYLSKKEAPDRATLPLEILTLYEEYMMKHGTTEQPNPAAVAPPPMGLARLEQREEIDLPYAPGGEGASSEESAEVEEMTSGRRYTRKTLRRVYRDVANYNDVLKNMCHRDIVRLTRNRNAVQDLYTNEENWLRQMKSEVSRTSYHFGH